MVVTSIRSSVIFFDLKFLSKMPTPEKYYPPFLNDKKVEGIRNYKKLKT